MELLFVELYDPTLVWLPLPDPIEWFDSVSKGVWVLVLSPSYVLLTVIIALLDCKVFANYIFAVVCENLCY